MNPEQWLSLKWNGGSTMSDRWLNQSKIIQPYSNSAVNWQKVLLDIEKKQCNQIIILTDCNEVPEEVKVLAKYKDLEIEIITDRDLDKGDFKLIEVK